MTRKKDEIRLPLPVHEVGYPAGDGPAWISEALGVPGCLDTVIRHLSDDGEETSLVLRFGSGREAVFRPARLVTTRRLSETLGALGFPVPYYQPPQLAKLGQAIGRVADRTQQEEQERSYTQMASLVATWAADCLKSNQGYLLKGRKGIDVRAAIEHVRKGYVGSVLGVPLIFEPQRNVVLVWTVPVTRLIRDRLGTKSDGDIGLALRRAGLTRERLAARPAMSDRRTIEMPVWVVPNGWQGVDVANADQHRQSGPLTLCPL